MHYGTPATIEDVPAYYSHIRRGKPIPQELMDDLIFRYGAIGGPSPLSEISKDQAKIIQKGLANRGIEAHLYIGTKHASPFVADAVELMAKDGIDEAVGVVLAPHFSGYSIATYRKYALDSRNQHRPSMKIAILERWGTLPAYIDFLTNAVREKLDGWDPQETLVIFSAHSLPVRAVANGDPYQEELLQTAKLVAERLQLPHWKWAFQSQSTTGEPWLGPDILEVIDANKGDYKNVVACTVGFVSDHLEVLYDLGIETKNHCDGLGLNYRRTEVLNRDETTLDALAGLLVPLYENIEMASAEASAAPASGGH